MLDQIESIAIIVFALLFMGVGLYRVVEFQDVGIPTRKRKWLVAFHVIGTFLLGAAFIAASFKTTNISRILMFGCFVVSLLFIAPGQFTLGMIHRRVTEEKMKATGKPFARRKPLLTKLFKKK